MPSGVVYFTLCINIANLLFVSSYLQSRVPSAKLPQAAWERHHVTPAESLTLLRPDVNSELPNEGANAPLLYMFGVDILS